MAIPFFLGDPRPADLELNAWASVRFARAAGDTEYPYREECRNVTRAGAVLWPTPAVIHGRSGVKIKPGETFPAFGIKAADTGGRYRTLKETRPGEASRVVDHMLVDEVLARHGATPTIDFLLLHIYPYFGRYKPARPYRTEMEVWGTFTTDEYAQAFGEDRLGRGTRYLRVRRTFLLAQVNFYRRVIGEALEYPRALLA